jgi:hypothetical protein
LDRKPKTLKSGEAFSPIYFPQTNEINQIFLRHIHAFEHYQKQVSLSPFTLNKFMAIGQSLGAIVIYTYYSVEAI